MYIIIKYKIIKITKKGNIILILLFINIYSPEQVKDYASKMLGHKLITKQTGAAGRDCNAVSI